MAYYDNLNFNQNFQNDYNSSSVSKYKNIIKTAVQNNQYETTLGTVNMPTSRKINNSKNVTLTEMFTVHRQKLYRPITFRRLFPKSQNYLFGDFSANLLLTISDDIKLLLEHSKRNSTIQEYRDLNGNKLNTLSGMFIKNNVIKPLIPTTSFIRKHYKGGYVPTNLVQTDIMNKSLLHLYWIDKGLSNSLTGKKPGIIDYMVSSLETTFTKTIANLPIVHQLLSVMAAVKSSYKFVSDILKSPFKLISRMYRLKYVKDIPKAESIQKYTANIQLYTYNKLSMIYEFLVKKEEYSKLKEKRLLTNKELKNIKLGKFGLGISALAHFGGGKNISKLISFLTSGLSAIGHTAPGLMTTALTSFHGLIPLLLSGYYLGKNAPKIMKALFTTKKEGEGFIDNFKNSIANKYNKVKSTVKRQLFGETVTTEYSLKQLTMQERALLFDAKQLKYLMSIDYSLRNLSGRKISNDYKKDISYIKDAFSILKIKGFGETVTFKPSIIGRLFGGIFNLGKRAVGGINKQFKELPEGSIKNRMKEFFSDEFGGGSGELGGFSKFAADYILRKIKKNPVNKNESKNNKSYLDKFLDLNLSKKLKEFRKNKLNANVESKGFKQGAKNLGKFILGDEILSVIIPGYGGLSNAAIGLQIVGGLGTWLMRNKDKESTVYKSALLLKTLGDLGIDVSLVPPEILGLILRKTVNTIFKKKTKINKNEFHQNKTTSRKLNPADIKLLSYNTTSNLPILRKSTLPANIKSYPNFYEPLRPSYQSKWPAWSKMTHGEREAFIAEMRKKYYGRKRAERNKILLLTGPKETLFGKIVGMFKKLFGEDSYIAKGFKKLFGEDSYIAKGVRKLFGKKGIIRKSMVSAFTGVRNLLGKTPNKAKLAAYGIVTGLIYAAVNSIASRFLTNSKAKFMFTGGITSGVMLALRFPELSPLAMIAGLGGIIAGTFYEIYQRIKCMLPEWLGGGGSECSSHYGKGNKRAVDKALHYEQQANLHIKSKSEFAKSAASSLMGVGGYTQSRIQDLMAAADKLRAKAKKIGGAEGDALLNQADNLMERASQLNVSEKNISKMATKTLHRFKNVKNVKDNKLYIDIINKLNKANEGNIFTNLFGRKGKAAFKKFNKDSIIALKRMKKPLTPTEFFNMHNPVPLNPDDWTKDPLSNISGWTSIYARLLAAAGMPENQIKDFITTSLDRFNFIGGVLNKESFKLDSKGYDTARIFGIWASQPKVSKSLSNIKKLEKGTSLNEQMRRDIEIAKKASKYNNKTNTEKAVNRPKGSTGLLPEYTGEEPATFNTERIINVSKKVANKFKNKTLSIYEKTRRAMDTTLLPYSNQIYSKISDVKPELSSKIFKAIELVNEQYKNKKITLSDAKKLFIELQKDIDSGIENFKLNDFEKKIKTITNTVKNSTPQSIYASTKKELNEYTKKLKNSSLVKKTQDLYNKSLQTIKNTDVSGTSSELKDKAMKLAREINTNFTLTENEKLEKMKQIIELKDKIVESGKDLAKNVTEAINNSSSSVVINNSSDNENKENKSRIELIKNNNMLFNI